MGSVNMTEKVKHIPTQQALMAALDFTDADLKANREGYLSARQRSRLARRLWQQVISLWVLAMLLAFFIFLNLRGVSSFSAALQGDFGLLLPLLFIGVMMVM